MIYFPRRFRLLLSLALAVPGTLPAPAQPIRIVAANLTSGNGQDYDPGHGIRILQGLNPDIVLVQEFNYFTNTTAYLQTFADNVFEAEGFYYYREPGGENIPNGILSRYPILDSGEWDQPVNDRDHAWARIDIPGNRELLVVSVHLRTDDGVRPGEATQLLSYLNTYYSANNGERATDYLVIGGDFNSDSRTETALNTLGALVTIGSPSAQPVGRDTNNQLNANTNANRNRPYDAVYAGKGWHALQVPTVVGTSFFPHGLVADTRYYAPLSDLSPAFAGDSGASNMQHHAVVKDFQIPIPADQPVLEILSSSIESSAPRHAQITFRSTAGLTYEVQASHILAGASWTPLGNITATGTITAVTIVTTPPGTGQVQDSFLASSPRRFYRVIRR